MNSALLFTLISIVKRVFPSTSGSASSLEASSLIDSIFTIQVNIAKPKGEAGAGREGGGGCGGGRQ